MPEHELILLFARPLNRIRARYIISGSVAATLYGEPRVTHDVDFVIFLNDATIEALSQAFPAADFHVPPIDQITREVARERRGHFNIIHYPTGFKADLYATGRDEFHAWAFRHSRTLDFCGEPLVVAPPEYVIVRKLEYFKEGGSQKHLRDIRSMLAISGEHIDRVALKYWLKEQAVETEWERVQDSGQGGQ